MKISALKELCAQSATISSVVTCTTMMVKVLQNARKCAKIGLVKFFSHLSKSFYNHHNSVNIKTAFGTMSLPINNHFLSLYDKVGQNVTGNKSVKKYDKCKSVTFYDRKNRGFLAEFFNKKLKSIRFWVCECAKGFLKGNRLCGYEEHVVPTHPHVRARLLMTHPTGLIFFILLAFSSFSCSSIRRTTSHTSTRMEKNNVENLTTNNTELHDISTDFAITIIEYHENGTIAKETHATKRTSSRDSISAQTERQTDNTEILTDSTSTELTAVKGADPTRTHTHTHYNKVRAALLLVLDALVVCLYIWCAPFRTACNIIRSLVGLVLCWIGDRLRGNRR